MISPQFDLRGEPANLRDAALVYATQGFYVFPVYEALGSTCTCGDLKCRHPAKHPRTRHGWRDATTNKEPIRKWWHHWPQANIGIACEPSGLVVPEIDPRHGGDASFEALHAELGPLVFETRVHQSGGGGTHYLFHAAPTVVRAIGSRANALGDEYPGIDVRAGGGYIVAPPSNHISGKRYERELSSLDEPAQLPQRLADMLIMTAQRKPIAGVDNNERLPEGRRHGELLRLAGRLRRNGMNALAIEEALLAMNRRQCDPPLSEHEVKELSQDVASRYYPVVQRARHSPRVVAGAEPSVEPEFELLSELDAAKFFARRYRHQVRHCARGGGWFLWDGKRWKLDDDGWIFRLAGAATDDIADGASAIPDLEKRKKHLNFAIALRKRRGIENIGVLAASLEGVALGNPECFDADPWSFNVDNGTIDLRTGDLRAHNRDDLLTKTVSIQYDATATCPRWDRFLDEVFCGDGETIDFVQRAAGYSLTGSTREQAFFVLHGIGANGKTTFLSTISKILGSYGVSATPDTFVDRRAGVSTNDLARLRGMRFVSSIETGEGRAIAESFVKAVTGGDRISARFLYAEFFEFEPVFKLWLGTNHKPVITGRDEGMWRRVRLVPFQQSFQGDRCDPDLRAKLDVELAGILSWAVQGCLKWQKHGLKPPASIANATAAYRSEMDTFSDFIEERCDVATDKIESATELYRAYRSWAEGNGERPASQRWFGLRLGERGFAKKPMGGHIRWHGICLRGDLG